MAVGRSRTSGRLGVSSDFKDNWDQTVLYFPSERRFDYDHPMAMVRLTLHRDALAVGAEAYCDPVTGDFVLCSRALMERGFCCSLGCRHCPFTGGRRPFMAELFLE
ncbi:DUF5522 domain-containing protein [Ferrimicrobium acidiphilum]|uniref:Uncharacterized protein n=1 Tax=Ferrimicrobium acidiphilum DSM 19497 TaxID=1121877 RepID=A0A0D8FUL8_9ACTN|nr:DUF5522 domain-containing protein [Ferrimicrobium acidiphilum]KJE76654.1 hypothetical protein FEAC_15830 [Ferrimicrobium acidiphilum DSM 19497]MCL5053425.1 DUF5522 domain-containing protein [Gammaproteobacteria bacterium]